MIQQQILQKANQSFEFYQKMVEEGMDQDSFVCGYLASTKEMMEKQSPLFTLFQDIFGAFSGEGQVVTEERVETWKAVVKSVLIEP